MTMPTSTSIAGNVIASFVVFVIGILAVGNANECVPRSFGYGSIVCVCNSTYCDSAAVSIPPKGQYRIYESGEDGKRFSQKVESFDKENAVPSGETKDYTIVLTLDPSTTYQKIQGFGGAFTDSTGINTKKLSEGAQELIIESYYGKNGSRYEFGRVPIGGSDFSTRAYTYDDHNNDVKLEAFALANEDIEYKIPLMQQALRKNPNLKFVSSSWTAPPWMKTNDAYRGFGFLKSEYYQLYAEYLIKFMLEYKKHGLNIWAVTTGNEPANVLNPFFHLSSMGWTPKSMARWVANNLGPTIADSEFNKTLILIIDDQRANLPWYPYAVFQNSVAKNYTAGIAVHWYFDFIVPSVVLDATHFLFPDKFLIMTEACVGSSQWDYPKVRLGDWHRGERYILSIMDDLNHWMTGWIDWNLVLDKQGGPNFIQNFVDAPIIVNPETDEFFKQPMYYSLAHFSKFLEPGSTRIDITKDDTIRAMAFLTPGEKEVVLVLYNFDNEKEVAVTVVDPDQGNVTTTIPRHTIQTIIYQR